MKVSFRCICHSLDKLVKIITPQNKPLVSRIVSDMTSVVVEGREDVEQTFTLGNKDGHRVPGLDQCTAMD